MHFARKFRPFSHHFKDAQETGLGIDSDRFPEVQACEYFEPFVEPKQPMIGPRSWPFDIRGKPQDLPERFEISNLPQYDLHAQLVLPKSPPRAVKHHIECSSNPTEHSNVSRLDSQHVYSSRGNSELEDSPSNTSCQLRTMTSPKAITTRMNPTLLAGTTIHGDFSTLVMNCGSLTATCAMIPSTPVASATAAQTLSST